MLTSRIHGPFSWWQIVAAWTAIALTTIALLLLAALHVLSPEFAPSWRMISEYAYGRFGGVLSLMFLTMGIAPWALAFALWPEVASRAGRAGMVFLIVAGLCGVMASFFDIRHDTGHAVAGLLGVIGFPIGALLVSASLARTERWHGARKKLMWTAHLSWVSVVLLIVTLAVMTVQVARAYGGHLPQHAPSVLPPGVLALDGWADRLIVLSNCVWVLLAAAEVVTQTRVMRTAAAELRVSLSKASADR